MSRIIGIDLGTTNSCVAVLDARGNPQVLASATAERTTPSVVAWTEKNAVLVGLTAKRQAITNPENTVFGSKRLIGRKVNAPEVSALARAAAFRIVAAPNGDAWIRIGKNAVSPQEIASHVLGHLRAIAEQQLGEPVTRAVVTVPAYFDEAQRQATRDAGAIAGLDIVRIVNEPTAAALAYGAHRVSDKRRIIAVFDLGGGTFDISIMAVENGVFEVLATGGDSSLGGEDWDRRMVERIADEIFDKYRVDITTNSSVLSRLREACETAKRTLSTDRETSISLPFLFNDNDGNTINYQRTFSRDALDELTADLRSRLAPHCLRALADASLTADQIEEVLLVGGMTRWPTVAAIVEQIFGRKPNRGVNPDEVVAQGAAAFAGILAGEGLEDAALLDVTPHDIGIKVGDAQFSVVIPRNSMLPVRARRMFATGSANQKFVQIELFQGDSNDVSQNRRLGQVELTDLPPGPAGAIRIELVLTVDVESILSVAARETTTNIKSELVIRPNGGLSQLDISGIIDRRRGEAGDGSKT